MAIRGVVEPLNNLSSAGAEDLFAYRYDWDDHRRRPMILKKLLELLMQLKYP